MPPVRPDPSPFVSLFDLLYEAFRDWEACCNAKYKPGQPGGVNADWPADGHSQHAGRKLDRIRRWHTVVRQARAVEFYPDVQFADLQTILDNATDTFTKLNNLGLRRLRSQPRRELGDVDEGAWRTIELENREAEEGEEVLIRAGAEMSAACEQLDRLGLRVRPSRASTRRRPTGIPETVRRDRKTEARDKWIYQECCKRKLTYSNIATALKSKHPEWEEILSAMGILAAAKRYAERHGLEPPPPRLQQS